MNTFIHKSDVDVLTEQYKQICEAQSTQLIKKIGDTQVEHNGATKEISDLLFELSNGGNDMITIFTIRKNNKRDPITKEIIAPKGGIIEANGKLGPCQKDVKGVGSPMGGPKERYSNYKLITMCIKRNNGEFVTRSLDASQIFKFNVGGTMYIIHNG